MNYLKCLAVFAVVFSSAAMAQESAEQTDMKALARTISQEALLVDTHIDMPYRLQESWADVTGSAPDRNFDYLRAHFGGLNVPFMSIYVPADMEESGGGFLLANQLIDSVEALAARAPNKFAMAHTSKQAENAVSHGLIALAQGMENGTPIEGDLENMRHFHKRGVRYVTLAHSKSNHISDSSYDENRPWGGLSPFGRELVGEMNRLGVMVDVSHLSDEAFYDVLEVTRVPVIASHSSARHFTPGWERNMDDEMIRALAKNGGVIMINFGSSFLTRVTRDWRDEFELEREAWSEETGHATDSPEAEYWELAYREKRPFPYSEITDVADHFDHVIGLVGVEHVGIGSDYDGVGDSLPVGLKDVGSFPNLVEEFLRRDYSREDVEAILGQNLMRVWRQVEQYAAGQAD